MKLVLCVQCNDVFKPDTVEVRSCKCGRSQGRYLANGLQAEVKGEWARVLGIDNSSLASALMNQPESGDGEQFTAFVIPKNCPTVTRLES